MTENERVDQLDRALEAQFFDREDPLLSIAADLVEIPSSRFRENFRRRLQMVAAQRSLKMATTTASNIRPGQRSVSPYLIVPDANALIEFAKAAFRAEEATRVQLPDGKIMHAELRIGDATVNVADGNDDYPARTLPLHIYVEDADATYSRAISAGAESLREPVDQDYGDREASIRDVAGNNWYIATHRATGHKPVGMLSVTPYLHVQGATQLIGFLEGAFGAETLAKYSDPDGRVAHAKLRIGDAMLEMSDAHGPWGPMPGAMLIYLEDVDAAYNRALNLGATSIGVPENKPYGDRTAGVRDRHGHDWFISRYLGE